MKKTVPFEIFEPNQFLMFDVLRLAELERSMGMSLPVIVKSANAGVDFCLKALPIALKQHYHKPTPDMFVEKMEAFFEAGGNIDDIATPIVKALALTGVFGKLATELADGKEEKADGEKTKDEEERKNE